jgi:methylase of polypeptide subunit release factors
MGCGPIGVLSALAARRGSVDVTAVDIVPEFVDSASAVLDTSGLSEIAVVRSDFGEELGDAVYDVILFNSAYIPTDWGEAQGINEGYQLESTDSSITWSGGVDGTDSIRAFLERMPRHLTTAGRIYLGFNRFYVDTERVLEIADALDVAVAEVHTWRLTPAVVMEVRA